MMNHKRIHPVSSFLVLLVVLVLGAGGAMAPALAAHEVSAPDLAPQATTVVLDGTPAVYKVTSTSGSGSSSNISFRSHDRYRFKPAAAGGRVL